MEIGTMTNRMDFVLKSCQMEINFKDNSKMEKDKEKANILVQTEQCAMEIGTMAYCMDLVLKRIQMEIIFKDNTKMERDKEKANVLIQ
jgi:hypothetical protein